MNVICIGAHPDDSEYYFGGTAAKLAAAGHRVKFVSVTNGDAGHHKLSGVELIERRLAETNEAARRLGIAATEVLDYHDGELEPSIAARRDVLRRIRNWEADLVLTHRPNDYHPDHRAVSQLVQDSSFLVLVPNICPETPPLRANPVFLYLEDDAQTPPPFSPSVVVAIDDVWERKLSGLDAHESQMYEWLPWVDWGGEEAPTGEAERFEWLSGKVKRPVTEAMRRRLVARYGAELGGAVVHAEAFEQCEFGRQPTTADLDNLLPK